MPVVLQMYSSRSLANKGLTFTDTKMNLYEVLKCYEIIKFPTYSSYFSISIIYLHNTIKSLMLNFSSEALKMANFIKLFELEAQP